MSATQSTPAPDASEPLARFYRLDQFLRPLPGADLVPLDAEAAVLGVEPARLRDLRHRFRAQILECRDELLNDGDLATSLTNLPFGPDDTVVCFGDSITADRVSWAEILAGVFEAMIPGVTVHNEGRVLDSTTDLVIRFGSAVAARRPDWVIVLTGRNDVCRYHPQPAPRLVSEAETRRNLVRLQQMISWVPARALWLAQPPVVEDMLAGSGLSQLALWLDEDAEADAAAMAETVGPVVDLRAVFDIGRPPDLFREDGVHPNVAGQTLIARAVLIALAQSFMTSDVTAGR